VPEPTPAMMAMGLLAVVAMTVGRLRFLYCQDGNNPGYAVGRVEMVGSRKNNEKLVFEMDKKR